MSLRSNFNRAFGTSRKATAFHFARFTCSASCGVAVVVLAVGRKTAPCPTCGKRIALSSKQIFSSLHEASKPAPSLTSKKDE